MDVSIGLVNFNGGKYLERCLKSIYQETKGIKFEVFVVDNNSSDGSLEKAKNDFPQARFIENQDNKGYAFASNQAYDLSQGQYFVTLNLDTEVKGNAFKTLFQFMEKNLDVGLVGPKLLNPNGTLQESGYVFPKVKGAFQRSVFLDERIDYSQPSETDWVGGSCLFYRKQPSIRMDGKYFLYFEDTDICFQFKKKGFKVMLCPQAEVTHLGKSAIKEVESSRIAKIWRESIVHFFKKSYGPSHYYLQKALAGLWFIVYSIKTLAQAPFKKEKAAEWKHYWKRFKLLMV